MMRTSRRFSCLKNFEINRNGKRDIHVISRVKARSEKMKKKSEIVKYVCTAREFVCTATVAGVQPRIVKR